MSEPQSEPSVSSKSAVATSARSQVLLSPGDARLAAAATVLALVLNRALTDAEQRTLHTYITKDPHPVLPTALDKVDSGWHHGMVGYRLLVEALLGHRFRSIVTATEPPYQENR